MMIQEISEQRPRDDVKIVPRVSKQALSARVMRLWSIELGVAGLSCQPAAPLCPPLRASSTRVQRGWQYRAHFVAVAHRAAHAHSRGVQPCA